MTHTHAHARTRTHARAHTHTHTEQFQNITSWLWLRCNWVQTSWKQCEKGVDRGVQSQNWSLRYKTVQVVVEQLWDKYSENWAHVVFWNYNCCYVDNWRSRIESRATKLKKSWLTVWWNIEKRWKVCVSG
jgi:hypothetical protein